MATPIGLPTASYGEFYRYTDDQGHMHFLDDYSRIPYQHRSQARTYPEKYDHLPDAGRRRCEADERYAALFLRPMWDDDDRAVSRTDWPLETPIVFRDNQVLVPVVLAHGDKLVQARMLLDTGAATTVFFHDLARKLDLDVSPQRQARLVGGRQIAVMDATVHSIRVGPFHIGKAAAVVLLPVDQNVSYQGLLGMNILQHLSYTIDVKRRVIRWNADASSKDLHAKCTQP